MGQVIERNLIVIGQVFRICVDAGKAAVDDLYGCAGLAIYRHVVAAGCAGMGKAAGHIAGNGACRVHRQGVTCGIAARGVAGVDIAVNRAGSTDGQLVADGIVPYFCCFTKIDVFRFCCGYGLGLFGDVFCVERHRNHGRG